MSKPYSEDDVKNLAEIIPPGACPEDTARAVLDHLTANGWGKRKETIADCASGIRKAASVAIFSSVASKTLAAVADTLEEEARRAAR